MEGIGLAHHHFCQYKLVYDDRHPLIRHLANIVKLWDRFGSFEYIGWSNFDPINAGLLAELDQSSWSLMLVNEMNEHWTGPNAIPFILKNLPFGKIAAAFYILPGAMWLTDNLYKLVSNGRRNWS